MTYDSAGNMTGRRSTGGSRTLCWNALGQLDRLRLNGALYTSKTFRFVGDRRQLRL